MADIESVMQGIINDARESGAIPSDDTIGSGGSEEEITPSVDDGDDDLGDEEVVAESTDEPKVKDTPAPEVKDKKPAVVTKPKKEAITPAADEEDEGEEVDGTDADALKKKMGKDNRMAHSDVTRIAATRERKTVAAVAEKLGLAGVGKDKKGYRRETFDSALDAHAKEHTTLKTFHQNFQTIRPVMLEKPEEYLAMLARRVNPEYANFVRRGTDPKETKETVDVTDKSDPKPGFDATPVNGKFTQYSEEGFNKLIEWTERTAVRKAKAEMRKELDEQIKPFKTEHERRKSMEEDSQQLERIIDYEIRRVSKRHGFKENEKAIQDAVTDPNGPYKDLETFGDRVDKAYDDIVVKKLVIDYDALYKKVLADIKGKAVSTSVTQKTPAPTKDELPENASSGDDPTTLLMKKEIARARRAGRLGS